MDTRYQILRRPKRKLCYFTNKESGSSVKQWAEKMSLEDIDGMFDGLDSPLNDVDLSPPSPLHAIDTESKQSEISQVPQEGQLNIKLLGPRRDVLQSAKRSLAPQLNRVEDLNSPFKIYGPVQTSSPLEEKIVVEAVREEDNDRALVVPQILNFEEPKTDLLNIQIPHGKIHVAEEKVDSELVSPPSKITLSKPTMSTHKKQGAKSHKESPPTQNKTPKPQRPVLTVEIKTPRQEFREPTVSAVRQEPVHPSSEKGLSFDRQPSAKMSTYSGKINTFLQKIRDAERIKPACSRALQSLVKVSAPPPEPEDDFLIMEDDTPLIYIPHKTSSKRRQKQTKAEHGSTDKDCLTDKETKDSPIETAQKDEELQKENPNKGIHSNKKMKPNRGKDTRNEVTGHGDDEDRFPISEDFLMSDFVEKEKPKKKKQRNKKVPKTHKVVKSSTPLKDDKASTKEKTDTIDLHSPSEKQIHGSGVKTGKALIDGQVNQNTLPVVSAGSLFEDSEVLEKRKRKQPGQWWLSCPQSAEETKVTDSQPKLKKTKQNKEVLSRTGLPSAVLKRSHKPLAPGSHEQTNTDEEKSKRNTKRKIRRQTRDKRKTTAEVFNTNEVEQIDDQDMQRDDPHEDLQEDLSPVVPAERDPRLSSGKNVFQRVYHHLSNENMSSPPTSVSPTRLQQQPPPPREAKADKRSRKQPGDWWLVNDVFENVEHTSSQPQKRHCEDTKSRKERKNLSKLSRTPRLGSPKDGNMAVSSKPMGGTTTPSLKPKPPSAPKTVKRSLATFKDIFTSETESETKMCISDTAQNNRHNVHPHSAEEAGVFLLNHDTPPDSKCQSESLSKELKSGPSSTIQLEQYEENEDLFLPSSRYHAALSMSDLCAPPLKPLILQPKDKANLTEWFKSLWPSFASNAAEITPNEFDWYFYQNRAIGFHLDADCGSACIGRILLGSYTKKPLWVDHSALTVFNLLTSSVNIVIDSRESLFHAGQCFTVQCGHAYSIQNTTAQPAFLYFTRILADGSD